MTTIDNPRPVESAAVTMGTIPPADLDRLIGATIPADPDPDPDPGRADCVYALVEAVTHARYAAEDIGDALEALPADSPQFAGVDLSAALRSIGEASRFLVPMPAGATAAWKWEHHDDGGWSRIVTGTGREVGLMSVSIMGEQAADGSAEWWATAHVEDGDTSPDQLRQFAALLIEAADEVDRLSR